MRTGGETMALADYLVHAEDKCSICFDCKRACGGCSWSEVDTATDKVRFEPVPGWTAEKVYQKINKKYVGTYRVKACPLFDRDEYRPSNNVMLTETESQMFLANINTILRMWDKKY